MNPATVVLLAQLAAASQRSPVRRAPVLSFPEPGMDDTAAYQGYETRFYRDSRGNVVQIYLDGRSGRVVNLWADAANESVGFTTRDRAGRPARLSWVGDSATASDSAGVRTLEYRLTAEAPRVAIGWLLLGSMRVERDFQYAKAHLRQFGAAPFEQKELLELIAALARLPAGERQRHLALLRARNVAELRSRLEPSVTVERQAGAWRVRALQPSFDDRNRLTLELRGDSRETVAFLAGRTVAVASRRDAPVSITVRISTDATPLTPLAREEIFTADFLRFLAAERAAPDSARAVRARWLEREVRGVELLSTDEKLMAGLPNFATYFGRDMMMTALMMRPVWTAAMSERVIASVLRKLGPRGDVSHEEALGGQAIREWAAVYDSLLATRGDRSLEQARAVLADLQRVRENYHMLDDEFQLPVLAARYLGDSSVSAARKRAFLTRTSPDGATHLTLLLRELALVARMTAAYVRNPVVTNLVGFVRRDSTRWQSASWRDSNAGYANGRFAMDINSIWAPRALEGIGVILSAVRALGLAGAIDSAVAGTPLAGYARDSATLASAVRAWAGAERHFLVTLPPRNASASVASRLAATPVGERRHWESVMGGAPRDTLSFLALSLDGRGRPIQVANTDPATRLFLGDLTLERADSSADAVIRRLTRVLRDVDVFMRPYPVGLFVERLGPVAANDAYATPDVWNAFRADAYHSPRVVWGREVNLFLLGLAGRRGDVRDAGTRLPAPGVAGYVGELNAALQLTAAAVEASGLKHSELWSYRITGGRLLPTRYGTSSDVQLWSATDLAVQFVLSR